MNTNFFKETITDKPAWKKIWDSKETVIPLLKYICETNRLKFDEPQKAETTVFRVGNAVIKIFYPPEIKFKDAAGDYKTELEAMKFCKGLGVLTPEIICNGIIYDNLYSFPYIVTSYIDGIESDKAVKNFNRSEKMDFALKLKEITDKIHVPTDIDILRFDDSRKIDHELWNNMSESFREDRKHYLSTVEFPEPVFVHGDLGHRNIIIDKQGNLNLIDFAESVIAPHYYEWKYYGNDDIIKEVFFSGYTKDEIYEIFTVICLIDWYGAMLIEMRAKRFGIDFAGITNVNAVKNMIVKMLDNKL